MKIQTSLNERMPVIDIVMTHKNRLEYLKKTLKALWDRTESDYTLSIIDDGSTDDSADYLFKLFKEGKLKSLVMRKENKGYVASINSIVSFADSPFFVFMTDDTIVPEVKPDWLERMWQEFDWCDRLGILGLKNPTADRHTIYETYEKFEVTNQINSNVIMIRPDAFRQLPLNAKGDNADEMTPLSTNCILNGFKVGTMLETYTCHIGEKSAQPDHYKNNKYPKETFIKVDKKTLKPKKGER
jgi:glycosyltransferase involved in cell wall biosynthesis